MVFTRFFDSPLLGRHVPLVLGWSDDQLWPIVDRLAQLLPAGLSEGMKLAVAACARSIVVEKRLTGCRVRYARAKQSYRMPKRYRCDDPRHSWHYVTNAIDILEQIGLIGQELGIWFGGNRGLQSVAWATEELMNRLGALVSPNEPRVLHARDESEVIVLRDRTDKKEIDYTDTEETTTMRRQVRIVNDALAEVQLYQGRNKLTIPEGRRVFNGSLDRGGRLYCNGPSFQNMPSAQRRELEVVIDGVRHPVVEIDYSNLHIEMAYQEARRRMRRTDQYAIKGFDRMLVKVAMNTVLNARSDHSGTLAVADELYHDRDLRLASGISGGSRHECRRLAERVMAAIKQRHWRIENHFGSDCGARFQRRDSDMAMQVMLKMIRRTGRCPLPVHDSFLVADIDSDALVDTMREVAHDHKLRPTLKVLRSGQPPTLLPYMEVTASDLGRWRGYRDWKNQAPTRTYNPGNDPCEDGPCSSIVSLFCYGHDPPMPTQERIS
ncbi:MAG TPA: hypothetical protein PLI79_02975 [Mycobacterium sp.]|nr:hypothetical protein [Mycobacterium sp.]